MNCRLAAIVFDRDDDPDTPLREFVEGAARCGARVAGLIQEREPGCEGEPHDIRVRNLTTGERLNIMQDLGRAAEGCRVDPRAIAVAAQQLAGALAGRPDLIVANRFGKLESEGDGMIAEIGAAVAEDVPLIVCVPSRFVAAWDAFAGGLDVKMPPSRAAIEAWWPAIAPAPASAA